MMPLGLSIIRDTHVISVASFYDDDELFDTSR